MQFISNAQGSKKLVKNIYICMEFSRNLSEYLEVHSHWKIINMGIKGKGLFHTYLLMLNIKLIGPNICLFLIIISGIQNDLFIGRLS